MEENPVKAFLASHSRDGTLAAVESYSRDLTSNPHPLAADISDLRIGTFKIDRASGAPPSDAGFTDAVKRNDHQAVVVSYTQYATIGTPAVSPALAAIKEGLERKGMHPDVDAYTENGVIHANLIIPKNEFLQHVIPFAQAHDAVAKSVVGHDSPKTPVATVPPAATPQDKSVAEPHDPSWQMHVDPNAFETARRMAPDEFHPGIDRLKAMLGSPMDVPSGEHSPPNGIPPEVQQRWREIERSQQPRNLPLR